MKMNKKAPLFITALLMASAVWPRMAMAQAPQVGVVDMAKLAQNYNRYKEADARVKAQIDALNEQLGSRPFLDDAEGKKFDDLIIKDNRSAAENTELQTLVKAGADRFKEKQALDGKERNDAEKARLKELNDRIVANKDGYDKINDRLSADMQASMKKQEDEISRLFKEAIGKIAGERKLMLVVDAESALWNAPGADITDEVLKRLNK